VEPAHLKSNRDRLRLLTPGLNELRSHSCVRTPTGRSVGGPKSLCVTSVAAAGWFRMDVDDAAGFVQLSPNLVKKATALSPWFATRLLAQAGSDDNRLAR